MRSSEHKPRQRAASALTFDEKVAAKKLDKDPRTLRRWRKAGVLPFIRCGVSVRYTDELLETFLKQNTRNLAA